MTMPVVTDANLDEFWTALEAGTTLFSIDLLAANPDVASQVVRGGFEVTVTRLVFEGAETFVALADDGFDGRDAEDLGSWLAFAETEPEARSEANRFIMEWKRAWGLVM